MMRLRTRLDKVELNLIDGAEDTDPANIGNIVNTRTPPRASTKGRKPRKSDTPKPRK